MSQKSKLMTLMLADVNSDEFSLKFKLKHSNYLCQSALSDYKCDITVTVWLGQEQSYGGDRGYNGNIRPFA